LGANKIISNTNAPLALITGAAKRIGAAITTGLHDEGYNIAIHYHMSHSEASELASILNHKRAASAFTVKQDLCDESAAENLIDKLLQQSQRLDLLVNNASIFKSSCGINNRNIDELWDQMQTVNLRTPYLLSMQAAPLLRKHKGSIINITDINAERPRKNYTAYCASKAGLVSISRSLAVDLAPEIRVNCVAPGAILWASSEDIKTQKNIIDSTPLKRRGKPSDIAQAVRYLAGAQYVTGHILNVDGGRILRG
jgi:pteridine reductase